MTPEEYVAAIERSRNYFRDRIDRYADKAFEYGVLTAKNALVVAAGGLVAVPTLTGPSEQISVSHAVTGGLFFACAVLLALVASYVIHINWSYHEQVWQAHFILHEVQLRVIAKLAQSDDDDEKAMAQRRVRRGTRVIWITFWAPHMIMALYLASCGYAWLNLYWAMGIGGP